MSSHIQDPDDRFEAAIKIEEILPNPETRRMLLQGFIDSILFADLFGKNNWAITNHQNYPNEVWLQVGHYATFTLENGMCWLALDRQLTESPLKGDATFQDSNEYGWSYSREGLHRYKDRSKPGMPISINGYYNPVSSESHRLIWPKIMRLHSEFIYKANQVGQPMQSATRDIHLPGVLKYLRYEFQCYVPDPDIQTE